MTVSVNEYTSAKVNQLRRVESVSVRATILIFLRAQDWKGASCLLVFVQAWECT